MSLSPSVAVRRAVVTRFAGASAELEILLKRTDIDSKSHFRRPSPLAADSAVISPSAAPAAASWKWSLPELESCSSAAPVEEKQQPRPQQQRLLGVFRERDYGVRHPSVAGPGEVAFDHYEAEEADSELGLRPEQSASGSVEFVAAERAASEFAAGNAVFPQPLDWFMITSLSLARSSLGAAAASADPAGLRSFVRSCELDWDTLSVAADTRIVPVQSDASQPFTLTNIIMFQAANGDCVMVDPGCNQDGTAALRALLSAGGSASASRCARLVVFLTHHHHDHTDGLKDVAELRPDALVVAHPNTLRRIELFGLRTQAVGVNDGDDEFITVGVPPSGQTKSQNRVPDPQHVRDVIRLRAMSTHGHTDGHMSVFDEDTRLLVAGDHVVGLGSALLDPAGGGDMTAYLDTCHKMLALDSRILCPAHGAPNYSPEELLHSYIKHRLDREAKILSAFRQLSANCDQDPALSAIVEAVYTDVPRELWPLAAQNVWLHMKKLQGQGDIPSSYELAAPRL